MTTRSYCLTALAAALALAACSGDEPGPKAPTAATDFAATESCDTPGDTPVQIAGGTFLMGEDDVYPEEGPVRETTVSGFWIDTHEVTNRQFAEFVSATNYVTVAEKPVDPAAFGVPAEQIPPDLLLPGSAVFTPPSQPSRNYADWWEYVPGTSWKQPYGPGGPKAQPDEPVVHLAWVDMQAYAAWKGGRIPTEAEWEFAASAGERSTNEQPAPDLANSWQGVFPAQNEASDGFKGIAPVGCFAPNANGLYDMVGNVWEVTADFYRAGHDPVDTDNPRGPSENAAYDPANPQFPSRVMKGGSYLCAPNYCQRYRPAARHGRDPGLGASNVGFRLAYDSAPASWKRSPNVRSTLPRTRADTRPHPISGSTAVTRPSEPRASGEAAQAERAMAKVFSLVKSAAGMPQDELRPNWREIFLPDLLAIPAARDNLVRIFHNLAPPTICAPAETSRLVTGTARQSFGTMTERAALTMSKARR